MADSREYEGSFDDFFETGPSQPDNLIRLSHLNNKSSVLCPEKPDITSQFIALQQLEAHQRMISRARSIVDTSAPKSLQSYISVADRQRKKRWQRLNVSSKPVIENLNGSYQQLASSRLQTPFSEEEDNVSLNASTDNKCVQTGIPFEIASSKTADKISWYLEALKQGEIFQQPTDNSKNSSFHNNEKNSNSKVKKKVVKGDFMDRHEKCFVQPKKPFSPRILPNYSTKAKLKDMKCYNPPVSKKKSVSSHSSDTFESYDNEEEESEDEAQKSSSTSSVEEESHIKSPPQASARHSSFNQAYSQPLVPHQNREYFETSRNSDNFSRTEEDEYLGFLSKVTEDILRSGVYSDKAIRQSFEFHMQFYKEDSNKEKLQSLLNQVLEGLKISSDDTEETASYRNPLLISFSRPNTPPVKDSLEILLSNNNPNDEAATSMSTVPGQNFNPYLTVDDGIDIQQNTLQDNINSTESKS